LEQIPEMVMLKDLEKGISSFSRMLWTLTSVILPHQELMTYVSPVTHREVESTAVLLFSSGSTGQPKGIMLSHHNINADVSSFIRALGWTEKERLLGSLPLFHSFGLMTSFWLPVMVGCKTVYVPSPLECSTVETAVVNYNLTVIFATPTFMSAYLRRCSKAVFENVRFAIVGAEKLRKDIQTRFNEITEENAHLLEAYGCTELAPVVTVNIGPDPLVPGKECGKEGSIGVAMPGITVKIVDPVTREELPPGTDGLLLVKGPVVMQGYVADPVRTANVISDGWYETGDIGHMDPDGYITLSGRLSRFSKIAGEMVPHELLECIMGEILGKDERVFAVSGIPDKVKGEALVVIYQKDKMTLTPEEMNEALRKHNIPNLWIPKAGNYVAVDALPVTGTGKLDLMHLNNFIKKQFCI
jgi:acyl-[acyl-carrier-protein]-phospholipid O-acyltransferase/long-chain-fatty-acid--[acyl-carrier-protein] ligase